MIKIIVPKQQDYDEYVDVDKDNCFAIKISSYFFYDELTTV